MCKWFETNFFNEIKDLEAAPKICQMTKDVIKEVLSTCSESIGLSGQEGKQEIKQRRGKQRVLHARQTK